MPIFFRGIAGGPKDLVRMMARELAILHPQCRFDVVDALEQCSPEHHGLAECITRYLVRPISTLSYSGPLVFILDAPDEWVHHEEFLSALARMVGLPGTTALKIVMTSRYSRGIDSIVSNNAHPTRELTPVSETVCREYFEEKFKAINWYGHDPGSQELDKLVEIADGRLQWGALVCEHISIIHPYKQPHQILADIIQSNQSHPAGY